MKNKLIDSIIFGLGAFVALIVLAFLISLIAAWPVMILWNWLIPTLFGLSSITFWQSWGLLMLCGFLFKSSNSTVKSK